MSAPGARRGCRSLLWTPTVPREEPRSRARHFPPRVPGTGGRTPPTGPLGTTLPECAGASQSVPGAAASLGHLNACGEGSGSPKGLGGPDLGDLGPPFCPTRGAPQPLQHSEHDVKPSATAPDSARPPPAGARPRFPCGHPETSADGQPAVPRGRTRALEPWRAGDLELLHVQAIPQCEVLTTSRACASRLPTPSQECHLADPVGRTLPWQPITPPASRSCTAAP